MAKVQPEINILGAGVVSIKIMETYFFLIVEVSDNFQKRFGEAWIKILI